MSRKNGMQADPKQAEVVKNRARGNLLVSASAGAGKTKVLVDRVVNELTPRPEVMTDGKHGDQTAAYGIDNFLIVTFTRAAAKEMKGRIQKKLQKSINGDVPHKQWFLRQIGDLPTANIGTLDAFCQQVVERYYYVIGLDPDFRVLNNNSEVILLRDQVWKNVREDLYSKTNDQAFRQLARNFFNRHINADDQLTDQLTNLVYTLYDASRMFVYVDHDDHNEAAAVNSDPQQQFKAWAKHLNLTYQVGSSLKRSPVYKRLLAPQLKINLDQIIENEAVAVKIAKQAGLDKESKIVDPELKGLEKLKKLLSQNTGTWDDLRDQALELTELYRKRFPGKTNKTLDVQSHDEIKNHRNVAKKAANNLVDNYFILDEDRNLRIIQRTGALVKELIKVVQAFGDAYRKIKQRKHVMEFIDIERAALRILYRSPAVRKHLQNQFHEIMIDEYQDDNQLQDAILSLVAQHNSKTGEPRNVFMVGDVKQSIYRFRSADPGLFLNKDKRYRLTPKQGNRNGNQEIVLQRNYRSTRNIDRFVNLIFSQIMDPKLGGRNYSAEPEIYGAKKKYENPAYNVASSVKAPVKIMIYDQSKSKGQSRKNDQKDGIRDSTYGQIQMVANEIQRLVIDSHATVFDKNAPRHVRRVKYSDVALIASTRDDNVAISDVFRSEGIPVQMLGSQNYFKTTEIQIMLSLLEIIDNPDQDIPLVAVLRSPMVGLNENQLAYLRIQSEDGNYYHAVRKFVNDYQPRKDSADRKINHLYAVIRQFLQNLKRFRKITQRHGLVDLIWSIYRVTGFLDYVGGMPAGAQRQANLHALYQRAADYEQANFHGLFQFVHFVHQLQNQQKDLTEAAPQQGRDMVTSLTIHGSKGLEFPIVFLIDASRSFNRSNLRNGYILSHKYGLGIKYYDPKFHIQLNTLPYQGIKNDEGRNDLAEEMRKLYVAMTRAEQRLYVVGKTTKHKRGKAGSESDAKATLRKHWESLANGDNRILDLPDRMKAKNYLDWIGAALIRHPTFRKHFKTNYSGLKNDHTYFKVNLANDQQIIRLTESAPTVNIDSQPLTDNQKQKIKMVMNFQYPHLAATREGNYRSVTDVKQLFEDPNGVEMGQLDQVNHNDYHGLSNQYVTGDFTTPQFIQNDSQRPKSTEVGTATHLVLQMMNLHQKPTLKSINKEIQRLKADQMIDPVVAKKVSRYNIRSFFYSSYGQEVLKHPDDYHRETPFSMLLKAHQVLPHEFKVSDPETILIHGIIDGYLYNPKTNQASIVDYKTDYVDFNHPEAYVKKIKDRYRGQLNLYATALSSILGHSVKHKYLYLLSIHRLVPIK